jgi:NADH:ubiquinone oxidoreductase subunit E
MGELHTCDCCNDEDDKGKLDLSDKKRLTNILAAFPIESSSLIPVLQRVQDEFGYVNRENMSIVADKLGLTLSHVYGVFSFYSQFRDTPPAKFTIDVCMGTACYVLGAGDVLNEFCEKLGLKQGEISADGMWRIMGTRCLGCCGLAPVVSVNGKMHGHIKRKDVAGIIKQYKQQAANQGGTQ